MMTTLPIDRVNAGTPQPAIARSPWIGRGVWLSLILLLCTTNILTLLDRDFRSNAYDLIARMAARPVLDQVGLSMLAKFVEDGNPAALEKIAIAKATERLMETSAMQQQEIAGLKSQRLILAVDRLNLQKQLRDSQSAMALHRSRASELGKKVLGRAARSVTRHLAALPGHALPILSATVAVGSVALDIHDACESLKELDVLNQSVGLPPANRSSVCGRAVPTADELLADARNNWRRVYAASAEALNAGTQMIPRTPPSVTFESGQRWLLSTLGR